MPTISRFYGITIQMDSLDSSLTHDARLETELLAESPPNALLDAARRHHAAEIVVGTHCRWPGVGGSASVVNALLVTSDRPVVVVPTPGGDVHGAEPVEAG